MGMGEIVAHVKFFLKHFPILGNIFQLRAEGLEHDPFAVFTGGVDVVKFLVPLGQMLYLGPFLGL